MTTGRGLGRVWSEAQVDRWVQLTDERGNWTRQLVLNASAWCASWVLVWKDAGWSDRAQLSKIKNFCVVSTLKAKMVRNTVDEKTYKCWSSFNCRTLVRFLIWHKLVGNLQVKLLSIPFWLTFNQGCGTGKFEDGSGSGSGSSSGSGSYTYIHIYEYIYIYVYIFANVYVYTYWNIYITYTNMYT
jgi:hypothetical protein